MRVPQQQSHLGASWGLHTIETRGAKDTLSLEERALLRQLKEVTDRQRDELRAHNRELLHRSQETEAVRAGRDGSAAWGGAAAGLGAPPASSLAPPPSFRSSCSASCWLTLSCGTNWPQCRPN